MQHKKARIWLAALSAVIGVAAFFPSSCCGQNQSPPKVTKKYYNKSSFHLPILLNKGDLPLIKQLILYAKPDGGKWQQSQVAPSNQRFFRFQAPRDGAYHFCVVTIDRNGNATPADINKEPPILTVVVDTQPPVFQLTPMRLANGGQGVRCRILDQTPDYNKLVLTISSAKSGAQPLSKVRGSLDLFELPAPLPSAGTLLCKATDAVGNTGTHTVKLDQLFQTHAAGIKRGAGKKLAASASSQIDKRPALPPPNLPDSLPLPPTKSGRVVAHKPVPGATLPPNPFPNSVKDKFNVSPAGSAGKPPTNSGARRSENIHLLTTTRASIQYRIDKMGASGVGKVDVYVKRENSDVWKHVGADPDRTSPADVALPGDGVYGVRIVVTNGHGIGGQAPAANETPDFHIEVDSTPPFAKLLPMDPLTGSGGIEIRWKASDRNLGDEAISLSYAVAQQGPWHSIVQRLKNTGKHFWQIPRDGGEQFFVKLEVTDEAGNTSTAVTESPIILDTVRPSASVVGVVGLSPVTQTGHQPELPR